MPHKYAQLTFTPAVRQAQLRYGARSPGAEAEAREAEDERLSKIESGFIAARDGFYLATVNADGWPYVQFRGGPPGFLHVLDERTLGYADFRGNRQYLSTGNLAGNERAALFFMDYANQRRLKVLARAEILDAAQRPDLLAQLADPTYPAHIERVVLFHVVAFDWNCPQHITPRFTEAEFAARAEP